jgi:hypothetical protein
MRKLITAAVVTAALTPTAAEAADDPCNSRACHHRVAMRRVHWCGAECRARVARKRWQRLAASLAPETKAMLARLRGCETRGIPFPANYRFTGAHDGAYQYDKATWGQAGGSGRASSASPAEQDVRTARFYPGHRGQWACRA